LDNLGELPQSYGTDTIFLVAQEPHWLFTYWDIDISRHPGGKTFLRVYQGEDTIEAEIEVPFETRNWYIPVKHASSKYTVEIGYPRASVWNVIARSQTIETPADRLSESDQFDYATIPLHLSFQKLMDGIQAGVQSGETLISALSRLQKEGKLFAFDSGPASGALEQRIILEALLGQNFIEDLASGGLSSQEIESRVRKHLEEKLTSAGDSLSQADWAQRKAVCCSGFRAARAVGDPPNSLGKRSSLHGRRGELRDGCGIKAAGRSVGRLGRFALRPSWFRVQESSGLKPPGGTAQAPKQLGGHLDWLRAPSG
jgi:hypothetical protein